MMERREFLKLLGLGLAGACAVGQAAWPAGAAAQAPELRLAFLSDAHLPDGDERRPEAQALARAVAELRKLKPAPSLVLFAGDLAHNGHPAALGLGKEILADLPAPLLMVMGEGDGLPDAAAPWRHLFGEPWFSYVLPKTENRKPQTVILGLHTAWCPGPGGPLFRVGEAGQSFLARELARLDPETRLLLLSHAPLEPLFRPWQQWTVDGPEVLAMLARFHRVLCLHGHTHNAGIRGQGLGISKDNDRGEIFFSENRNPKTENPLHFSLPATAWPGPTAVQGTPARLTPGWGPAGCGWAVLAGRDSAPKFDSHLWEA
jgi:3',5'-cyclic AMP phosphodiesterase CpdA